VECLLRFEARREFSPTVQPLPLLAYEAALLAGPHLDAESELLAKECLIPLSSNQKCTALDDKDNACKCDFFINEVLYGEYDTETGDYKNDLCTRRDTFASAYEMMEGLMFEDSYTWCTSKERLQDNLMNALLGTKLAAQVNIRFGTLRLYWP